MSRNRAGVNPALVTASHRPGMQPCGNQALTPTPPLWSNIVSATMPSPPPIAAGAIPCGRSRRISVCIIRASAGLSGHAVACRQKPGVEAARTIFGEPVVAIPPSERDGVVSDALTQGISRDSNVRLDREIQARMQKASSDTHAHAHKWLFLIRGA